MYPLCWRPSPPSPLWWCHEPWCCNKHWSCQTLKCTNHQHSLSHTHPHWWTFKLKCYIKMSPTSLVSSTRLSLPTTMSMTLTTNTHVLNDVRHVESIKIFDIDPDHHSIWHPSWRKFQLMWYILMSGTSLVFSFLLSLPSMVSSTAKSHVINVVRDIGHVESIKKLPGKPPLPQHIRS